MASVADLKSVLNKDGNIRESLDSAFLIRTKDSDREMPATLADADGTLLSTLAEDNAMVGLGIASTDGYTIAREREMVERRGHGYQSANRRRVTSAPKTLTLTPLEKNALTMEIIYGRDLSEVKPNAAGEYIFDEPLLPVLREYEGILIVEDQNPTTGLPLWHAFVYHKLVPNGEFSEVFNEEDPQSTEIQFSVDDDNVRGKNVTHHIFGPGLPAEDMGLDTTTAP